jgi:asparagine synthase (glutamine-hydrolysing)
VAREQWGWVGAETELFARGSSTSRLFTWDGVALLMRGYARSRDGRRELDLGQVAQEVRHRYRRTGSLEVDGLEGSFTLALLDSRAERVLLFRSLVGTGSTYYHASRDGLLFAGSLPDLLAVTPGTPPANREVLPDFFLFRCVPGRETLFRGVHRLLPGEEVCWDVEEGLTRRQRHTFATLAGPAIRGPEAIEAVDAVMAEVLRDQAALHGEPANLLSGGVDSSYIQAVYNQEVHRGDELPVSYSLSVDHPMTWIDTDYAVTASQLIGTRHMLEPADGPYRDYLHDTLSATAEPVNHVQSAYFGHLARRMAQDGVKAGLCGEGADSLFGLGLATRLQAARILESLCPIPPLRSLAASACGLLGMTGLAQALRLAGSTSDLGSLKHPVNQAAVFTDLPRAIEAFGRDAVVHAFERRRALLDLYDVPDCPLERLHAVGLLGEAIDTAGLWATLFQQHGVDLLFPFLDSRMLRVSRAIPPSVRYRLRKPKDVLKRALARRAPREIAYRVKLGFGQPVFEWLAPGGQMAPLASQARELEVLPAPVIERELRHPTWLLFSLTCYGQWHRLFIEKSLPASQGPAPSPASQPQELPEVRRAG